MNRAFTLIELIVVIAIILVLAAILFPVFAQAKLAAKRAVALANQKQIGLAILLYTTDYDDHYPRNDGCELNSSLNPKLNDGTLRCAGVAGFGHRFNHFSWQKWVRPYIKDMEIVEHPLRRKDSEIWDEHGEIVGGFAINGAITGTLDTYSRPPNFPRQYRNSWLGGTTTSIPDPSATMLVAEFPASGTALIPAGTVDPAEVAETAYPLAIREFWRWKLMDGGVLDCITRANGTRPDHAKIASGGLTIGFTDGSARFIRAVKFLAMTPSKAEYLGVDPNSHTAGWTFQNDCVFITVGNTGITQPDVSINYPLWGLGE